MADIHNKDADLLNALALGEMLKEHKGGDVVVIDLRTLNMWTDFFIIATVTSGAHLGGLQRHIKETAAEKSLKILRKHRRLQNGDEWDLTDFGNIVIHLMSAASRSFYELERLWSGGEIYQL